MRITVVKVSGGTTYYYFFSYRKRVKEKKRI